MLLKAFSVMPITSFCSSTNEFALLIFVTARFVFSVVFFIISVICLAAWDDSSANFLISSATTAKPLPASPTLAASIAAFRIRGWFDLK
jgi:hypothetical protein